MKRLSFLVGCMILASSTGVFADTFDFNKGVLDGVQDELKSSAAVRAKPKGMADICKKRIEFLSNVVNGKYESTVDGTVNKYMQICQLHAADFDIVQLRRSGNFVQLSHNANSIIQAYWRILGDMGMANPDERGSARSSGARMAVETAEPKSDAKRSKVKFMGKRSDRQNRTQNGRSYRK